MAEQKLIPARYTGHHAARLAQRLAFNIDGSRRQSSLLESGDTLMMPEREILGFTLLHDPHMVQDPLDLGPGRRVLPALKDMSAEDVAKLPAWVSNLLRGPDEDNPPPDHKDLKPEQLAEIGYEFHGGRTDFEPLEIEGSIEESKPADKAPPEKAQSEQEPPPAEVPVEAPPEQDPLTVLSNLSSGG